MFKEIPSGSGKYLPVDAWGNEIRYQPAPPDAPGRLVSATLKSDGLDGKPIADSVFQLGESEVVPADEIKGNINVVVYNSSAVTYDPVPDPDDPAKTIGWKPNCSAQTVPNNYYYARAYIDWVPYNHAADAQSDCINLNNIGQIYCQTSKDYSKSFSSAISLFNSFTPVNIPIGKVVFWAELYKDSFCTSQIPGTKTEEKTVFISDGQKALALNLSFQVVYP